MLNKVWSPYVVGLLSNESSHYSGRNVFVNNNEELQFYLKIQSNPPHSFPNSQKEITCFGSDLIPLGFEDEFFEDHRRIAALEEFLEDNLLIFQVEKKMTANDEFYRAKNLDLIYKKSSFSEKNSFFPIPLFTEKKEKKSAQDYLQNEFIQQMQNGKFIGRNDYVSNEPDDTPRFVLYKTTDNTYYAFGEFEGHQYAHGGFRFKTANGVLKQTILPADLVNEIYFYKESVAFVSIDMEYQIMSLLEASRTPIGDTNHTVSIVEPSVVPQLAQIHHEQPIERQADPTEAAFMEQLIAETKKMMLGYKLEDLYNFHTSIKAGGLVILAGMSGTGKSQLVNAYQKALNLDSDKFLMIPVSPTWADDSDLIGYPDIINNVYRAADTGLAKLLMEAQKNPTKTFMVCFDEMNLAKVEHYFSQFLSVLEMEKGRRRLRLYNPDLQNKFYNGLDYTPEILIGDNVVFVGTVNFDESTHHFSDKLLDRANLIQLSVEPFVNLLHEGERITEKQELNKPAYDLSQFIHGDKKVILAKPELEMLWEIHLILNDISDDMGIGPRIVRHIDRYVKNMSDLPSSPLNRSDALDIQLVQRVLPKLRGSEEIMKHVIGVFEPESGGIVQSELLNVLDRYNSVSDFKRTRHKLIGKSKELLRHGYTI